MKLFRRSLLIMGSLSALGWFIIRDICFLALLPLIPLGIMFYRFAHTDFFKRLWLNGLTAFFCLLICTYTVSIGLFEGRGWGMLIFALLAVALMASQLKCGEWARISGWWMTLFLTFFVVMFIATLSGVRPISYLPACGNWGDILVFYFLVFLEPLALGKEYRASPLALGILLVPFGLTSVLALGTGAFEQAQYAYLSVWTGVSIFSLHHLEGILLCLYYGGGALRVAYFVLKLAPSLQSKIKN